MANIKIIIETHKKYWMPQDDMYLPIHVGAEGKTLDLGYQKDNVGENISKKMQTIVNLLVYTGFGKTLMQILLDWRIIEDIFV